MCAGVVCGAIRVRVVRGLPSSCRPLQIVTSLHLERRSKKGCGRAFPPSDELCSVPLKAKGLMCDPPPDFRVVEAFPCVADDSIFIRPFDCCRC